MKNIIIFIFLSFGINFSCSQQGKVTLEVNPINIRDFGAKGNGKINDTEAFLLSLSKITPGQTLFIPEGTYSISNPIVVNKNNIKIVGEKGKSIIKFDNSTDWYKKYSNLRMGMINITSNNVEISNLFFDQNFRESNKVDGDIGNIACLGIGGKYLGRPVQTRGIKIENCKFYDCYSDCISVFNAKSSDLTIRENTFVTSYIVSNWTTAGVKGEQAIGITSGDNILIEKNDIQGALDDAIAIHHTARNLVIQDNTITTTGGRILINGVTGGLVKNNEITYIQDGGTGILVSFEGVGRKRRASKDIVIDGNKIKINPGVSVKSGISLFGCGENIRVINNEIISENKNVGSGIIIKDLVYKRTGEYHLGDKIEISSNLIKDFKEGVILNITDPKFSKNSFVIEDNNFQNLEIGSNIKGENLKNNKYLKVKKESSFDPSKKNRITRSSSLPNSSKELLLDNFMPQRNNDKRYSDFFISSEDKKITGIEVEGVQSQKHDFRIIDVFEKKQIFRTTINELSKSLKTPIFISSEKQYRIAIFSVPQKDEKIKVTLICE